MAVNPATGYVSLHRPRYLGRGPGVIASYFSSGTYWCFQAMELQGLSQIMIPFGFRMHLKSFRFVHRPQAI